MCIQRGRVGWDWWGCLSNTLGTSAHLTDSSWEACPRCGSDGPLLIDLIPTSCSEEPPTALIPWKVSGGGPPAEAWTLLHIQEWAQHKAPPPRWLTPVLFQSPSSVSCYFQLPRRKTRTPTQPLSLKFPRPGYLCASPCLPAGQSRPGWLAQVWHCPATLGQIPFPGDTHPLLGKKEQEQGCFTTGLPQLQAANAHSPDLSAGEAGDGSVTGQRGDLSQVIGTSGSYRKRAHRVNCAGKKERVQARTSQRLPLSAASLGVIK